MARSDFIKQLEGLGFKVEEPTPDRIVFQYTIPVGRFMGKEIKMGFVVQDGFPVSPPTGPHISPRLLPQNPVSGPHPTHGVHDSPFGAEWQYWSRPHTAWATTDRSVRAYMAHIRHLFDTQ